MSEVHAEFPTKDAYETECSPGDVPISTIDLLLQSVQNWARTVLLWNVALDSNLGPHKGGCSQCPPLVFIASDGSVTYPIDYYQMAQFSKFVVPGAVHIAATSVANPTAVAFVNPDGTLVLVAHNGGGSDTTFKVRWTESQSFSYTLPAGATATFTWPE